MVDTDNIYQIKYNEQYINISPGYSLIKTIVVNKQKKNIISEQIILLDNNGSELHKDLSNLYDNEEIQDNNIKNKIHLILQQNEIKNNSLYGGKIILNKTPKNKKKIKNKSLKIRSV